MNENILKEEISHVIDNLETVENDKVRGPHKAYRSPHDPTKGVRLRFDIDYNKQAKSSPEELIKYHLFADLEDLIVNGDVNAKDALLKAMDGEVKRDKKLLDVELRSVLLFEEDKGDWTEYTLFVNLTAAFG